MGEFHIDGEYNMRLPPYNVIKLGAKFDLSGDQTVTSFIGRIDGSYNESNVTLRRHEPTVDICLTYNGRGYWETVSERAFAAGLVESGREYLTLAREEVIPAALEHTDLYEPEAEMHHEDLDELEALLDKVATQYD